MERLKAAQQVPASYFSSKETQQGSMPHVLMTKLLYLQYKKQRRKSDELQNLQFIHSKEPQVHPPEDDDDFITQ